LTYSRIRGIVNVFPQPFHQRPLWRFLHGTGWDRIETRMQFIYIETMKVKPGTMTETLRKTESELLPLYRQAPGFVAYTIARTDEISATALSIWQTREQAEHGRAVREAWIRQGTLTSLAALQHAVGSLPFLALTRELASYTSAVPGAAGRHA
jgi:heme-degrading monooxygenase HmoA